MFHDLKLRVLGQPGENRSFRPVPAPPPASDSAGLRTVARISAALSALVGAGVLASWYYGTPLLTRVLADGEAIRTSGGIGFLAAGVALYLFTFSATRPLARLLALMIAAGAGAIIALELTGWEPSIDQASLREILGISFYIGPSRASLASAVSFALFGAAMLFAQRQNGFGPLAAQAMLVVIAVQALLMLIRFTYGAPAIFYTSHNIDMPILAALTFIVLTAGLLAASPEAVLTRSIVDTSAGGVMMRRLLPGIVLVPILLGWLYHTGFKAGYYDASVGIALFAVSFIVLIAGLSLTTANALRRTDRDRHRLLLEFRSQREWLRTTLASIADAVIATDANGTVLFMNDVAEQLTGFTSEQAVRQPVWEVYRIIDEATGEPADDPAITVLREKRVIENATGMLRTRNDARLPVEHNGAPIANAIGGITGVVLIFRDITQRRRAEERQSLLVRELNHRVRNVFMIVQSLVRASSQHTARMSASGLADVLAKRLQSLGRAHELLLDTQWSGASLRNLVERELEPFLGEEGDRIVIKGPDILVPPQCTSILAIALHELTVNAVRHGALGQSEGKLDVRWRMARSKLTLTWTESGKKISASRKSGFGMQMIEKGIGQTLGGDVKLEFHENGLRAQIAIMFKTIPGPPEPGESRPEFEFEGA